MKILELDIETAPHSAFIWSLWQKYIAPDHIEIPGYPLCFAAKWRGQKRIHFYSVWHHGLEAMIQAAFDLLDEADAVVHYNGNKFDIPMLSTEFIELKIGIPTPFEQIDLLPVVRKHFRFPSNKLDYVCRRLGIGAKISHRGMELWAEVMEGKRAACKEMKDYNIQDVHLLRPLYDRLLPYITTHPNWGHWNKTDRPVCPNCGSHHLHSKGSAITKTQRYPRFQCQECGTWVRGRFTEVTPEQRVNILTQAKL